MPKVRLVSVNIEYSKHLDKVSAFLVSERPDVACIQELREIDCGLIADSLGVSQYVFTPVTLQTHEGETHVVGLGIFSRTPIVAQQVSYYTDVRELPPSDTADSATYNHKLSPVLSADIHTDDGPVRIITTHFTWTPDGSTSDEQRSDIRRLLAVLQTMGECVLCGDFNAPRVYRGAPGEIFALLAQKYRDNIPLEYTSSLDPVLHRAGKLNIMVDGLFTTPGYQASDVRLRSNVSDHCAITATVTQIP